jgi:hypothetical protein
MLFGSFWQSESRSRRLIISAFFFDWATWADFYQTKPTEETRDR